MAKKYQPEYFGDEFELLKAIKFCYDKGVLFYPIVVEGQTTALKFMPKVNIVMKQGDKYKRGSVEYAQNDELYDKIRQLYVHKYEQLNKK